MEPPPPHLHLMFYLCTNPAEVNLHLVAFVDNPELKGGFLDPSEEYVLKVTQENLDLIAALGKFGSVDKVAVFGKEQPLVDETNHGNNKKKKWKSKRRRGKKKKKQQQLSNDASNVKESSIELPRTPPLSSFGFWFDLAITKKDIDATANW